MYARDEHELWFCFEIFNGFSAELSAMMSLIKWLFPYLIYDRT